MIRTLVVDDEQPARERLCQLLRAMEDVVVAGEAEDGEDALEKIHALSPDLVFLDIQMPGKTGLEVAAALPVPRPRVIFCTAFDQYAIDAFEVHAVDYLLKPVNRARLLKAVARVGKSISETHLLSRDVETAGELQSHFFPRVLPAMESLQYCGISRAARGVTGDYYDFLALDSRQLAIILGDVSGKGMPAGLVMAGLQGRFQARARQTAEKIDELISEINRTMCASLGGKRYVTLFYAVYDDAARRLTYVNAGHNPPLLHRTDTAETEGLTVGGTVIGLLPHAEYRTTAVDLRAGDVVLCYTDGISEALNPDGEEFGEARLRNCLRNGAARRPDELARMVYEEVDRFSEGVTQADDQTVVVAKVS